MPKQKTAKLIDFDKARAGIRNIMLGEGFVSNSHWLASTRLFENGEALAKAKSNAQFTVSPLGSQTIQKLIPAKLVEFKRTPLVWDDGICFVTETGVRRWLNKRYVEIFNLHVMYGDDQFGEFELKPLVDSTTQWNIVMMPFTPPDDDPLASKVLVSSELPAPGSGTAFFAADTLVTDPTGKKYACYCKACVGIRAAQGAPSEPTIVRKKTRAEEAVADALPDPEEVAQSCRSKGCSEPRVSEHFCEKHTAPSVGQGTSKCVKRGCLRLTEKAQTGKGSSVFCDAHDADDVPGATTTKAAETKTNGHAKGSGRFGSPKPKPANKSGW